MKHLQSYRPVESDREGNAIFKRNSDFIANRIIKNFSKIVPVVITTSIMAAVVSVLFSAFLYQLVVLSGVSADWIKLIKNMILFLFFISFPIILFLHFPLFKEKV